MREFLDNALDAGAKNITAKIIAGGITLLEVSDDGSGMSREDLELCTYDHATSKIEKLDDLDLCKTMGFRGEALAAAAASANLEILTSQDGREAWLLESSPEFTGGIRIRQARRVRGTTVRAMGLFDATPARKKFLKRESAEGAACRLSFIEKALPFPNIDFRFEEDGELKLYLPATESLKDRFADTMELQAEKPFLNEISGKGEGFSLKIIAGGAEIFRNDRKKQFIFANGRRIQDYALLQAFEYGLQGVFPNGTHPVGAVFIEIDPALADFNIHPAKREVRFKNLGAIHRAITQTLAAFVGGSHTEAANLAEIALFSEDLTANDANDINGIVGVGLKPTPTMPTPTVMPMSLPTYQDATPASLRYIGRVFNLFIIVEKADSQGGSLYLIDQHAAHERILFDQCIEGGITVRQDLLSPIVFTTEDANEDAFLQEHISALKRMGLVLSGGNGRWQIEALPQGWQLSDSDTVNKILELKNAGEDFTRRWAATTACHSAIRDGDYLDASAALNLAQKALALPDPHCPHGRPVYVRLSREDLLKAVKRI
jgi:DNA mismatch repair protein MutL